jgi:hypothetical protein
MRIFKSEMGAARAHAPHAVRDTRRRDEEIDKPRPRSIPKFWRAIFDVDLTCFDLPDGSILAVNCSFEVVFDRAGSAWPWLVAVPDQANWEALLKSPSAPDFWTDCFRIGTSFCDLRSDSLAA